MSQSISRSQERPPAFVYQATKRARQSAAEALHCDKLPALELARRYGTPLYVYSASMIRERVKAFEKAFHGVPHTICYAVKANSNLSVLHMLARLGLGFDVVSGGELQRVLRANRSAARRVVFSGVGKTAAEINLALRSNILAFNVESGSELQLLAECGRKLRKKAQIALRVNPDVSAETHPYISTGLHEHKFGIPIRQARELYRQAAQEKWLKTASVSVHIGSQIRDLKPFREAMERVAELVRELRGEGHDIRYVDAGGGLGISYDQSDNDTFPDRVTAYAEALTAPLRNLKIHLLLEPGRSIVGPAGILLTRVIYKKTNGAKKFLIVDAAMNDLIRPALYSAHHEIVPVQPESNPMEKVDIVGPVCETGDFLARDRELRAASEGDLLAILDAGAYGMAQASNYNTRPRAAEVLVDGAKAKIIRKRETVRDLLRGENI
ncbi:MAG TPA: diaminopimelate decarboxylase [Terriglobales bacterium]|nr:diaminopimelate decarboxylase [Terriglobales bacterium]